MNVFRGLIWCLLLAAVGAVAWESLASDMGFVLIRWHGKIIETTVAYGLIFWLLISVVLWSLWFLVRLPFNAWQTLAKKQARSRLINGLQAFNEARYARAENLLLKAAKQDDFKTISLMAAHDAANRLDEPQRAALHQAALLQHDPDAANMQAGANAFANGNSEQAVVLLAPLQDAKKLSPQAQFIYLQALEKENRAADAVTLLNNLRKEQALSPQVMVNLDVQLHISAMTQSSDADTLVQQWLNLPERLRQNVSLLKAFAARADTLGLETKAVQVVSDHLNQHWTPELLASLADISVHANDQRLDLCETWLPQHADDAALHAAMGKLYGLNKKYAKAEAMLQRSIALAATTEAWESLGNIYNAQQKNEQASTAYANALRLQREQLPLLLTGQSLREQIASQAVAEIRNEHGFPLLPKS
ncbi:MAG: heme biosynthesis HemY N-terminal domain-containing protein [Arenimonas sp.]